MSAGSNRWVICFLGLLLTLPSAAQLSPAKSIAKALGGNEEQSAAPAPAPDPLGRGTPQGTILGFLEAAQRGDYALAGEYLQMTTSQRQARGEVVARELKELTDRNLVGQVGQISHRPEGSLQPGLPPDRERVGYIRTNESEDPVILARVLDKQAGPIWLISADTVARIPELYQQVQLNQFERHIPKTLVTHQFLSAPIYMWLAFLAFVPVAAGIAWLLIQAFDLLWRLWERIRKHPSPRRDRWWEVSGALWLTLATLIHAEAVRAVGIPLLYRFYYGRLVRIILIIGIAWLVWKTIAWAADRIRSRAASHGGSENASLTILGQRILRSLVFIAAVLTILSSLGVDTTTALAGLGIGGIAIAFAAQKTLENLFGGVSVLGDRVISVGDVVKVGDTLGTIEDISLRSLRIRTMERTQVSIPNGALATMNVENLTRRDKLLFRTTIGLRYETTPDQLRFVLAEIRKMLYAHPVVEDDTCRVRFLDFGESALNLEIFSYLQTTDLPSYLAVREDLLLRIMDIVQAGGTSLAFPSRTLYLSRDSGLPKENTQLAAQKVKEWREKNQLPFPDFSPDTISSFEGSIVYPDRASAVRPK